MNKTVYIFVIIVLVFILAWIFLAGSNPFSFGNAYFRPRASTPSLQPDPSYIVISPDSTK